ncbi:ABC transporter ATP-binding protein [uncultured Parolsenella sp.]|uniref:ABC transporter ATP-binding protein n=1 Tax=uncultured Parolsenella sp. TaxID=2083008 RepID=UPI002658FA96|nr:ABC transporter ATP-binding protein [uncultured Parolsenella sp.]
MQQTSTNDRPHGGSVPHASGKLYQKFLSYYRSQWHLFAIDSVAAVVMTAVDLAFPIILRELTGGLFTQGAGAIMGALGTLALGLIAMYAVRYACRYFVGYWGHVMGARMESRMRQDLFDQYERFSFSYYDRHNTGDLMSRVVSDLFDICEAAHHGPEYAIICGIKIVGSFAILATINWKLSCVLAVITAVLWAYNSRANKRMRAVFMENRKRISGINSQLEDSLSGIRVVKGFAAEDVEREKFARSNEAYLESKQRMYHVMGGYQAMIAALMGALFTVVIVYGGYLIAVGEMQPVDLSTYALYITTFTAAIEQLLNFTETFQKAEAGFRRLDEILATKPDVLDAPGAKDLEVSEGHVTYEGVHFSYDGEHDVICGLDLDIHPGETIALVGPSGGGKSTTCSLLPRFYDVASGSIVVDGQDVRDVTQKSLREAIGLVQQDVYLFDGTIGENIAYGRPSATFEEVREAARLANIDDFVMSLPEGYETQVGERGARLSGGQKQRISIARVFLKDPKILVLDEATSALDNESEHAVQESLARLSHGRTTLVIAHRLSTIRDADEIVTVDGGRVAERGTHDELMALGGTYASYYRMQFGHHA